MRIRFSRPSPAMIVAATALFVALGGTGYAALKIPKNAIGAKQIASNAVGSSEIKTGAVHSTEVKNGTLLKRDFKKGTLPSGGATGAAGGDLAGTYPSPTIRPDAVTGAKIAESTLGRVPDADKLDGVDSSAFTRGAANVLRTSVSAPTTGSSAKIAPPITIPGVGEVSLDCAYPVGHTGTVEYGYTNRSTTTQTVFVINQDATGTTANNFKDLAPGEGVIRSPDLSSRYSIQVVGANRYIDVRGALTLGAVGCRAYAQAVVTG